MPTKFEDIRIFQNDGATCLLFPFTEDVQVDMGKLAIWRLQTYSDFGSTWLSDYVPNYLGGFVQEQEQHVYFIDESFLDVTPYLTMYGMTAKEIAQMIIKDIKDTVGTICTCGIGTNLYLAKIALDIKAKHAADFIGILDEASYRAELWDHRPITDFWQIAAGKANRLRNHGITTMREVAMMDEDYLYDWFGIDAELLIDHAWGRESTTIRKFRKLLTVSQLTSRSWLRMLSRTCNTPSWIDISNTPFSSLL